MSIPLSMPDFLYASQVEGAASSLPFFQPSSEQAIEYYDLSLHTSAFRLPAQQSAGSAVGPSPMGRNSALFSPQSTLHMSDPSAFYPGIIVGSSAQNEHPAWTINPNLLPIVHSPDTSTPVVQFPLGVTSFGTCNDSDVHLYFENDTPDGHSRSPPNQHFDNSWPTSQLPDNVIATATFGTNTWSTLPAASTAPYGEFQRYQPNSSEERLQSDESAHDAVGPIFSDPSRTIKRDRSGALQGTYMTYGRPKSRKRGRRSESSRENACILRQNGGPCERCKRLKRKCVLGSNPYEPCYGCRNDPRRYKGLPKEPCFRFTIFDVKLFRDRPTQASPLYQSRELIYQLQETSYESSAVRTLHLTNDIGGQLEVYAAEFEPSSGDRTAYEWVAWDGPKSMEMPPYCLTDLDRIKANARKYAYDHGLDYLEELRKVDGLVQHTFNVASNFAKSRRNSVVNGAIRLWCVCRMIEKPWRICGPDTLCISKAKIPESHGFGSNPITPMMDTQLDQIFIQGELQSLRTNILRELDGKIRSGNPEHFFEIFLTIFILLFNCESVTAAQIDLVRRFGLKRDFPRYPSTLDKYFDSANILVCYFNYVCRGSGLFRASESINRTDEQTAYMKVMKKVLQDQENYFMDLKNSRRYDEPLYWCHQLFYSNRKPIV